MTEWLIFVFCGLVWGSSYYWIKVALEEVGPITLVAWRLLFAVAGLLVIARLRHARLPRERRVYGQLALLSLLSPGIPFMLISWGETRIDSGIASILNGTVPMLTLVAAHVWLPEERMTRRSFIGLLFGFGGILTLFGRDLGRASVFGNLAGQGAVLLASMLYALSSVYSRNLLRRLAPLTVSLGQMFFADALAWTLRPVAEGVLIVPHHLKTWVALAWMGLLGSCLTFLFYHRMVTVWGAGRSAAVNYIVPAVGLTLGLLLRGEQADWHLWLGAGFILGGIALINFDGLRAFGRSRRAK